MSVERFIDGHGNWRFAARARNGRFTAMSTRAPQSAPLTDCSDVPAGTVHAEIDGRRVDDCPASSRHDRALVQKAIQEGDWSSESERDIHLHSTADWCAKLSHASVLLIRDGAGRVIGTAVYAQDAKQVALHNLRIDPAHRGRGSGRATMRRLQQIAADGGPLPRRVTVYSAIETAKPFYAATGFTTQPHSSLCTWDPPH